MKYVDEFRDEALCRRFANSIAQKQTRPWRIMEVCGGQTHAIVRFGIDELLPPPLSLLHGPGCPVCVTPVEMLDRALAIAARPNVIFCSFGDMLRVPGSTGDLFSVKSAGGDVRMVYSPLDALTLAAANPGDTVVFLGIGFETTAPTVAAMRVRLGTTSVLRALRADTHTRHTPVVVVSGDTHPARIDECFEAGATDYLTKPLDAAPLLRAVDDALKAA